MADPFYVMLRCPAESMVFYNGAWERGWRVITWTSEGTEQEAQAYTDRMNAGSTPGLTYYVMSAAERLVSPYHRTWLR